MGEPSLVDDLRNDGMITHVMNMADRRTPEVL
jgi:hypothetical protein